MTKVPVVDSHHHFWEIERFDYSWMPEGSPLAPDYGPADLKPLIKDARVAYTVIVQAVSSPKAYVISGKMKMIRVGSSIPVRSSV